MRPLLLLVPVIVLFSFDANAHTRTGVGYHTATLQVGARTIQTRHAKTRRGSLRIKDGNRWVRAAGNRITVSAAGRVRTQKSEAPIEGLRFEVTAHPKRGFTLRTVGFEGVTTYTHVQQVGSAMPKRDLGRIGDMAADVDDAAKKANGDASITLKLDDGPMKIGKKDEIPFTSQRLLPGATVTTPMPADGGIPMSLKVD